MIGTMTTAVNNPQGEKAGKEEGGWGERWRRWGYRGIWHRGTRPMGEEEEGG